MAVHTGFRRKPKVAHDFGRHSDADADADAFATSTQNAGQQRISDATEAYLNGNLS
jgi:hypothetical protein